MKIAICGKMCSGKTTLANDIRRMDGRYTIYSFGAKVKDVAHDLFSMDEGAKDRSLLTGIGTKMREIDPDVWVKYVLKNVNTEFCLIDDLRYQNEYEALAKNGWTILQLHVPRDVQEERIRKKYPDTCEDHLANLSHESEAIRFTWLPGKEPVLTIDASQDYKKIYQQVYSFIQKHEYNR